MRPLSSSPQQEQHMDDVFSATCVGSCGAVCTSVHGSVSVVHGVHVCPECRWPWRRFSASVFAKCAHICRMCRTLSQNSTRLGIRLTTRTSCARIRKNSSGKDFSLGSKSEPWRRIRELFRPEGKVATFPGRPGPSGGGFGDLAKSGAPAAILINAYSGDFCHPVLSNALAQEPLVYHSGTRELFSDIFGNTSKTDGTFSDIFGNFDFFDILTILLKNRNSCAQLCKNDFLCSRMFEKTFRQIWTVHKNIFMHETISANVQMCKCANVQMCKNRLCTKCANLQRKYFSKCRNAQICKLTNLHCAHFCLCKFFFVCNFFVEKIF